MMYRALLCRCKQEAELRQSHMSQSSSNTGSSSYSNGIHFDQSAHGYIVFLNSDEIKKFHSLAPNDPLPNHSDSCKLVLVRNQIPCR